MNIDDRRPTTDRPTDRSAHSHTLEKLKRPQLCNASSDPRDVWF